jgi:hypothetical protein
VYVAVEDHYGLGAGIAAVALQPDGRLGLDGWLVPSWDAALADLRRLYEGHESVRLVCGASIMARLAPGMRATPGTVALTRSSLSLMREVAHAERLVHCSAQVTEQIETVRVTEAPGGLAVMTGARSDLLRAASWALTVADRRAAASVAS